jgi:hypothetical protein
VILMSVLKLQTIQARTGSATPNINTVKSYSSSHDSCC